jgi:3-oxoacyl-[acyl-carrier-protein] synthase-3
MDIAYCLPETRLTNDQLSKEFPHWNVEAAADKVGVFERKIAGIDETALDLSLKACETLLDLHPGLRDKIDAVLFCTQTPDYIMPSNAFLIHDKLKLSERVIAFDYNLACSGYVYGVLMASSLLQTGLVRNVLLITGDTYSKLIDHQDRSTRMLFGDGAAATWISSDIQNDIQPIIKKLIDFDLGTKGSGWNKFIVPSGTHRRSNSIINHIPATDKIHMDGIQVLNFAKQTILPHMKNIMQSNNLSVKNIDQFIIHQASKLALDMIKNRLNISDTQCYSNMSLIGNTVSSSIPILLKDYSEHIAKKRNEKILVTSFGVGYSWGSIIAES